MQYTDLPSLYAGKQNRGNTTRRRPLTAGQCEYQARQGSAARLRGLGEGAGSIPWQSDVLPSQFIPARPWSPQLQLYAAVLEVALADLQSKSRKTQEITRQWFRATEQHWPLSFENICVALGCDPGQVRSSVLGKP